MNKTTTFLRLNNRGQLLLCAGGALALATLPGAAFTQTIQDAGQLNVPYGKAYDDSNQPFNPRTRDANGNRTIINGRIFNGNQSTLSFGIGQGFFGNHSTGVSGFGAGGFGSGGAIGNQLNVITSGNWNTVIIDSTQINTGNQNVTLNGKTTNTLSSATTNTPSSATTNTPSSATTNTPSSATTNTPSSATTNTPSSASDELNGSIQLND